VQPLGVSADQYRDVILEVVAATDLAPRSPGERWPHYKTRAAQRWLDGLKTENRSARTARHLSVITRAAGLDA
jgi:hypothetical protein